MHLGSFYYLFLAVTNPYWTITCIQMNHDFYVLLHTSYKTKHCLSLSQIVVPKIMIMLKPPGLVYSGPNESKGHVEKNENVENETDKKKEVNTLKGNSSHRETFSTISPRFKMWVLFHHDFLPDVGIMCINLNNIFSVTHCSNIKRGKDFLPFFHLHSSFCSIAAATFCYPEELCALTSKHKQLHQHIKVLIKRVKTWELWKW